MDEEKMNDEPGIEKRKSDHIRINLEEDVSSRITTGLEDYRFVHEALPEINLSEVDFSQELFGKTLRSPIMISSMTGGTDQALKLNMVLAQAAEEYGLAMGVGSQRVALENNESIKTFQVRKYMPGGLLFANLGAVQLNYGLSVNDCRRAVEMIEADALILHLNPIQEALQEDGNTDFEGLLYKIEEVCRKMEVPVIAKEVGWGISAETAIRLANTGVKVIDVAGAGGTSWSQVEKYRMKEEYRKHAAEAFRAWGIPTAESIVEIRAALPGMKIFASGGLRDGIDIIKCIALGANLGGMAGLFLKAAAGGIDQVRILVDNVNLQIRIGMFGIGVKNLQNLKNTKKLVKYRDQG